MSDTTPTGQLTVRFWAAAQEAAGTHTETYAAASVRDIVTDASGRHPALIAVLPRCSLLLDGVRVGDLDTQVLGGQVLEVLPPFAGG
ncbi:molybdopterin converting factor small subunit [Branchiibius hedensis]|uniref:Molybdopterin converting factor, small subunit n=1 Tax=Branchiibius hedensis TaxID=672460 RepID=A0A2Y9BUA9_9MICO|nr:MoaD/ThiS family protein [Branchiibius hedensis]PWJ26610.1 molybdopterin converting factor small subunit [Branchiibius hedensis]SSA35422.1 Molybdopterin converting factor, small subunit [Branchiibius hedensis]